MTEVPPPRAGPSVDDFPATGRNALASPSQRTVSTVVDGMIALVPGLMVLVVVLAIRDSSIFTDQSIRMGEAPSPEQEADITVAFIWGWATTLGVWVAYQVVALAVWGQTLGSVITSSRVARWSDGKRPDWHQAALRALLPAAFASLFVSSNPFLWFLSWGWVVVFMAAFSNPLRRGFHDLAAGTIVVRTR